MWIMRNQNALTFQIDFYLYYEVFLKKIRAIFALTLYKLTVNANIKMVVDLL